MSAEIYSPNHFEKVLTIVDLLPKDKKFRSMIKQASLLKPWFFDQQYYKKYSIDFLPNFVDADCCFYPYGGRPEKIRVQGYLMFELSMFHNWTEKQLDTLIDVLKNGEVKFTYDEEMNNQIEIWVYYLDVSHIYK